MTMVNHLKVSVFQPNLHCSSQLAEGTKISHFKSFEMEDGSNLVAK